MITAERRKIIKEKLEEFLQELVALQTERDLNPRMLRPDRHESRQGNLKPFHESLLPDGLLSISAFERSFSTKLGTTFEECARLIALDNHHTAHRTYRVQGEFSVQAFNRIGEIIDEISNKGMQGKYLQFVKEIVRIAGIGRSDVRKFVSDLLIVQHDGTQVYIELKSPKPNKGQCLEATSRQLNILGCKHQIYPKVKAYFAMAYNPYGVEKASYNHSFACRHLDMNKGVLLGKEFWELVGGPDTYEEILEIYQEVGRENESDVFEKLLLKY